MFVTQTLHSRFARARAIDQVLDRRFGRVLNGPPLFAVPAGTSAVPRHGPFQARGPSCRALTPCALRVFPPFGRSGTVSDGPVSGAKRGEGEHAEAASA
jgi:hypothetical protein